MDNNYQDTKECPMCAETVKEKATLCRFCHYEFAPILKKSPFNEEILDKETLASDHEDPPLTGGAGNYETWKQENPQAAESFEVKYDVWISSKYNEKVCNEIIKITKWETWVAGKFLLELEKYGNSMKLVEEVDMNNADRIKNSLEKAGAKVTIKSSI